MDCEKGKERTKLGVWKQRELHWRTDFRTETGGERGLQGRNEQKGKSRIEGGQEIISKTTLSVGGV